MMRYTVVWHKAALDSLAEAWMTAPDRAAVTAASAKVDAELADDPDEKGESHGEDRLLIVAPLTVAFCVYPDDRRVEIMRAIHHARRQH
jgi:plasmid stabilization system protein ParE